LGAGQWLSGQHYPETFPHLLLMVGNFSLVEDWTKGLSSCTSQWNIRKGQKALEEGIVTVGLKEIVPDAPAPHSTLVHF
jgi:hypothetical protein